MRIQLLHVRDCPNIEPVRRNLRSCLAQLGLDVSIEDLEGAYPSPTLLIDGVDVMGVPASTGEACRLDLPTAERILAALSPGR